MSQSFFMSLTAGLARVGSSLSPLGPTRREFLGLGGALLMTGCALPPPPRGPAGALDRLVLGSGSLPSSVQPIDPAIPWDWPSAGPGQISSQQFNFCDTQPASCEAGARFVSGAGSFSDAYRALLELVDAKRFSPASMLASARSAAAPPTFLPSAGVGPPGWVAVANSGGVLEFKPEWVVAITAHPWAVEPRSWFRLDVSPARGFLRGTREAAALDTRQRGAAVSIKGLSRIPVYAGAWYSDSFVRIAARGPFTGPRSSAEIVGPSGILRCRVTELFVAAEISASVTLDSADAKALLGHLALAPEVRIGSVAAGGATVRATPAPGGTCVEAITAGKPLIIAVSVQPVLQAMNQGE